MAYHFAHSEILPQRTLAAGGIILLHLLVVYLLATALMHTLAPAAAPPLVARFVAEPTPVVTMPNVMAPDLRPPSVAVEPPPVPAVAFPTEPAPAALTPVIEPRLGGGGVVATPGPVRMLGRNVLPDSEDYYPADRRRLGIEGAALVQVCVDARGTRAGEPLIEESSQDAQLDAAALNVARHGRYASAQQDGVAVPNCYRFHIVFRQAAH
jgi:TonB family protein